MISLSLNNITLVLGAKTIFKDLTWQIGEDQKIGLIGPNGTGKSSLFKVIMGEYAPEPGGTVNGGAGERHFSGVPASGTSAGRGVDRARSSPGRQ